MNRTIVDFNHVSKKFFNKKSEMVVISDMSFHVDEGEIVALVGPSGAGKTTILNLISELLVPEIGEVKVDASLGYMFQKDNLFDWLTIYKNIALGLSIKRKLTKDDQKEIEEMAKRYGLYDFLDYYPTQLSGGMRQKVALMRTLLLKPSLLLLDEPFSSLDYITRLDLEEEIFKIIKNLKISAIIVTHDISEAIVLSNRIYVLSARPCTVKKEYILNEDMANARPNDARMNEHFQEYFKDIVETLR
ncbi:MAG TPA: spermidine/putrescine ABC transporter ATP-binding protein [Firmicutes bacterium]|nr:spermidine/putrescine ABC transporter ATP-binding protein [Bacillota bacterium]